MKTIVLASVLKPVDEPRMYEKIGLSLASQQDLDVNIIGFKSKNLPDDPSIHFFPLFGFQRLDAGRLLAPFRFLKLILRIKPDILIVGTHELLISSLFFKLIHKSKLVYDIRENYYANIRHTAVFPPFIKDILAAYVRIKERFAYPFLNACLLAEKCYLDEMPWLSSKSIVIENKFKPSDTKHSVRPSDEKDTVNLIFSGTIAEHYGIFEAIELAKKLHSINPRIRLTIAGYAAQKSVHERVVSSVKDEAFINYNGRTEPLPHQEILAFIKQADFALLPYQPNRSTQHRIPTKFFEYAALRIPMIISKNPVWERFMKKYQAGIVTDFENINPQALIEQMNQYPFYKKHKSEAFDWKSEEKRLLHLIGTL